MQTAERAAVVGSPDLESLTTSHLERAFLTVRQELKRFQRKGLGYSKDLETHKHAVALHFGVYNFVRKHHSLGTTPAVAAGLEEKAWGLEQGRGNDRRLHAAERGREVWRCLRGIGMLITLALLLPLKLSVTLAALLTLGLLPVALSKIRRSPEFALMTLAMLGVLWRGEAWKTVCLAEEAQLSRQRQLSPKTMSIQGDASTACGGVRCVLQRASLQYGAAIHRELHLWGSRLDRTAEELHEQHGRTRKPPLIAEESSPIIHLMLWPLQHDSQLEGLALWSQGDISADLARITSNRTQHPWILYDIYCLML